MALPLLAAGKAALTLAPFFLGGGGKKYKPYRPKSYLTREDYDAAEATRGRGVEAAGETGRGLRIQALRRYRARGIAGSPAEEATLSRIGDTEALGREHARTAGDEQLYNVGLSRQIQDLQGYHAQQARNDLSRSTFLNSLLEYTPRILGWLDQQGGRGGYGGFDTFGNDGEPDPNYG